MSDVESVSCVRSVRKCYSDEVRYWLVLETNPGCHEFNIEFLFREIACCRKEDVSTHSRRVTTVQDALHVIKKYASGFNNLATLSGYLSTGALPSSSRSINAIASYVPLSKIKSQFAGSEYGGWKGRIGGSSAKKSLTSNVILSHSFSFFDSEQDMERASLMDPSL